MNNNSNSGNCKTVDIRANEPGEEMKLEKIPEHGIH